MLVTKVAGLRLMSLILSYYNESALKLEVEMQGGVSRGLMRVTRVIMNMTLSKSLNKKYIKQLFNKISMIHIAIANLFVVKIHKDLCLLMIRMKMMSLIVTASYRCINLQKNKSLL